ncbi:hypothetical protein ACFFSY_02755 [Paenibacillus aurantiacus]|uniref:GAF domain-containing protein n=1 Tax=Paenibacillus aurantiacus TaxID=1936118 RepID=A0ABV5KI05_9BACL
MNGLRLQERLSLALARLCRSSGSDFAALALPAADYRLMRWNIVLGGRNAKVAQLKIKPGVGIGGMVLRHGTVYTVNEIENAELLTECPVMLAERLTAGIAYPVQAEPGGYSGILLLGRRGRQAYEKKELPWAEAPLRLSELTGDKADGGEAYTAPVDAKE